MEFRLAAKMRILFLDRHGLGTAGEAGSLQSAAADLGHSSANDLSESPDILVAIDWHQSFRAVIDRANKLSIPSILIKLEPSVVIPEYSKSQTESLFTAVFEVGRPFSSPPRPWGQNWDTSHFNNLNRLQRAVSISSNKYSLVKGELYSIRSKAYATISSLDLFGMEWERSTPRNALKMAKECLIAVRGKGRLNFACLANLWTQPLNYVGESEDKLETLSKYRYSVVIENSLEFMSEKLIDCILAGTIPIYVGPPTHPFGIPQHLIFSAEPNLESINKALIKAEESNWGAWRAAASDWVFSASSRATWEAKNCDIRIIKDLDDYIKPVEQLS
jgi:hypothetical protein